VKQEEDAGGFGLGQDVVGKRLHVRAAAAAEELIGGGTPVGEWQG